MPKVEKYLYTLFWNGKGIYIVLEVFALNSDEKINQLSDNPILLIGENPVQWYIRFSHHNARRFLSK